MESRCNYLRSPTNNYIEKKKDPNSAIHYITVGNHSCIMCTFPQGGQNHTKVCFSPLSSSLCLHSSVECPQLVGLSVTKGQNVVYYIIHTVLQIQVFPKINAPRVSKPQRVAKSDFLLILKIFLTFDDIRPSN